MSVLLPVLSSAFVSTLSLKVWIDIFKYNERACQMQLPVALFSKFEFGKKVIARIPDFERRHLCI